MFGFESFDDVEGISLLDMIAAQYVDDFKQLLKAMSRVSRRRRSTNSTRAAWKATPSRPRWNLPPPPTKASRASRWCSAAGRSSTRNWHAKSKTCVNATRSPVYSIVPTFMVALEQAVAQAGRSEGQSGFLLIEPDHYARILPEFGLDSADALIAALAAHVASVLDDSVVAARFGEHSFALLMNGNYARTHALAEIVRDAFAQHVFSVGVRSATVTVSIGGVQIGEKDRQYWSGTQSRHRSGAHHRRARWQCDQHLRPGRGRSGGRRTDRALGQAVARGPGWRRLRAVLPAGAQSTRRAAGAVSGLPAPGTQWRNDVAECVHGDCRRARSGHRDRPLGGGARDPATGRAATCRAQDAPAGTHRAQFVLRPADDRHHP